MQVRSGLAMANIVSWLCVEAGGSEGEAVRSRDLSVIKNCPEVIEIDQLVFIDNIINI